MSKTQILLNEYSWIALWWSYGLLTGSALLTLLKPARAGELPGLFNLELRLFFAMVSGIALQVCVLILLALAGLLTAQWVLLVFSLLAVGSAYALWAIPARNSAQSLFQGLSARDWVAIVPPVLLMAGWMLRPLGPAMDHDEISYHLPYARFYLENSGLAVNEYLRYPLHAHNFNLLYVLAMMRDSTTMAHLVHATAGFVTLLGVHGVARHWYGPVGAFIAMLALLGVGSLQEGFGNAFVDLGLMMFVAAAVFSVTLWSETGQRAWLYLAGLFLGMAMGTKYFGALFTVPLGLWVWSVRRQWRDLLLLAVITSLFGLFWYLRSWLISGNPVHPFLSDVFGYYIWTQDDLAGQLAELRRHGVDKTVMNLVRLPEWLLTRKSEFHGYVAHGGWLLGFFYFGLLYAKRMPAALRLMAVLSILYLVFWFSTSQVMRYLLPIAPMLALVAAFGLSQLWKGLLSLARKAGLPSANFTRKLVLPMLVVAAAALSLERLDSDRLSVPINPAEQHQFLTAHKEGYELFQAAAADPRIGDGPLLQFRLEGSVFYFPGTLYGDWMGHHGYKRYMDRRNGTLGIVPAQQIREMMREKNIRGVVFHKEETGYFYPTDIEDYRRLFDTVLDNEFGTVMVPRD